MKDIANQPKQGHAQAKQGGDKKGVAARRAKGRLTRERLDAPFDADHCGRIDDVIFPQNARKNLCYRFAMLRDHRLENPGSVPPRGGV